MLQQLTMCPKTYELHILFKEQTEYEGRYKKINMNVLFLSMSEYYELKNVM